MSHHDMIVSLIFLFLRDDRKEVTAQGSYLRSKKDTILMKNTILENANASCLTKTRFDIIFYLFGCFLHH